MSAGLPTSRGAVNASSAIRNSSSAIEKSIGNATRRAFRDSDMRDQNDEASSLILGHPIRAYRSATAGPSSAVWLVSQQNPLTIAAEKRELLSAANCTVRSEEHTSELQSIMRISYAVFCLKKKKST